MMARAVLVSIDHETQELGGNVVQVRRSLWRMLDPTPKPAFTHLVMQTVRTRSGLFAETVAYRATSEGVVLDHRSVIRWSNDVDHTAAMKRAGYRVVQHAALV